MGALIEHVGVVGTVVKLGQHHLRLDSVFVFDHKVLVECLDLGSRPCLQAFVVFYIWRVCFEQDIRLFKSWNIWLGHKSVCLTVVLLTTMAFASTHPSATPAHQSFEVLFFPVIWLQVHSHVCLDHGIEEQPSLFIVQKYESQLLFMLTSL